MQACARCDKLVCQPCVPLPDGPPEADCAILATLEDLRSIPYVRRLAVATANLGLSRREIPNWMADVIFEYRGSLRLPDGRAVHLPDTAIDDVFNNDGSFRWLSDFMKFADRPMRQAPQKRVLKRLRLIDLAFRIDKPQIARHFGR